MVELWDIYDGKRVKTGRLHRRGEPLSAGEYHMVVDVWVRNSDGLYLISKRAEGIPGPGLWQCTCGSATAGDTSLTAALREANEELGLNLDPDNGRFLFEVRRIHKEGSGSFFDIWLFQQDIDIGDIVLQEGETVDAKWVTREEIMELFNKGEFNPNIDYFERVFAENDVKSI